MKKIKVAALILTLVTLVAGCGNTSNEVSENTKAATTPSQSETASEEVASNESEKQNTVANTGSSVLIAYFSRIGNIDSEYEIDAISSASVVTQGDDLLGNMEYMADLIQDVTGGDIHFIETSKQYPSEYDSSDNNDLDIYVNKENRENARPELAAHVENMDVYDTVFLGFPNWYGDMPMAVYSFLDEYDLSGKKIYLFNSSGGGGARNAYSEVSDLEPDAEVEKNIFSVSHSQVSELTDPDMQEWLDEVGYDN